MPTQALQRALPDRLARAVLRVAHMATGMTPEFVINRKSAMALLLRACGRLRKGWPLVAFFHAAAAETGLSDGYRLRPAVSTRASKGPRHPYCYSLVKLYRENLGQVPAMLPLSAA
jgi:hypothetical protein